MPYFQTQNAEQMVTANSDMMIRFLNLIISSVKIIIMEYLVMTVLHVYIVLMINCLVVLITSIFYMADYV